ncbi:hypothetical protein ACI3ER_11315 [Bacillus sp. Wb]
MYKVEVGTKEELNVIEKALEQFNFRKKEYDEVEEFLKGKEFQLGDYVIKKNTTYFDSVFGSGKNEIGKIISWDFNNNYYRVHFSENNPSQGVREGELESYTGEVPVQLQKVKLKEITGMMIKL